MPTPVGLYLRISEDRTGEGLGVDRQRREGMQLIRQRGLHLAREYVDNDVSAAGHKRRPGFDALLHDIEHREVRGVVSYSLSRLTRNKRDELRLLEACQFTEAIIILARGGDLDTSTAIGRAVAQIQGTLARLEIEEKGERHVLAARQAAEAGKRAGGPRPFGYTEDGLHLDPVEAPVGVEIYERFAMGETLADVANWLRAHGVVTSRGNPWRPQTVRAFLANPRNAGIRGMRPVIDPRTGRRAVWHVEVAKAVWPGLVSEDRYRQALAILKDPGRLNLGRDRGGNRPKYLLSGIAVCGECGAHMVTSYNGKRGARAYVCSRRRHVVRTARLVEAYVVETLLAALGAPATAGLLAASEDGQLLDGVRAESVVVRDRLRHLAQDYADGVLDREQMRAASQRLRARLGELDAEIAKAGRVDVISPLAVPGDAERRQVWESYPMSTRRLVVAERMTVRLLRGRPGRRNGGFDPGSVEISWR